MSGTNSSPALPSAAVATDGALQLARSAGYTGNSPALLGAYEAIYRLGIQRGREGHNARKAVIEQLKAEPGMFFAAIRPSLCTEEAIEDANRVIFGFRNLPTWRQEMRVGELRRAKERRVYARFFRRFGRRLWVREAA